MGTLLIWGLIKGLVGYGLMVFFRLSSCMTERYRKHVSVAEQRGQSRFGIDDLNAVCQQELHVSAITPVLNKEAF